MSKLLQDFVGCMPLQTAGETHPKSAKLVPVGVSAMMECQVPEDVKEIMTSEQLALLIERRKAAAESREQANVQSQGDVQTQIVEQVTSVLSANDDASTSKPEEVLGVPLAATVAASPSMLKEEEERVDVKPATPSKEDDSIQEGSLHVQQYCEPHLVCEPAARLLTGKTEPDNNVTPLCAQNSVPEQVPHNYMGLSCQQNPRDSTSLVAEGQRGPQYSEYPNPYANMRTTLRKNAQASGYDKNPASVSLQLENNFYTTDQRLEVFHKEVKKEVIAGMDQRLEKVDKRNIRYWERKGLPTEGILLNKKMLLCLLTPDKVLWKYFTKVQGSLHPDLDMEAGMRRNMSALYEKVFERELSTIDGKVSMKFGRAFIAQELKGKKFNWAQYALSEHIRISERNAKKAQRKKYTRQLADSDQDDEDTNYVLDDEDEIKFKPSSRRDTELDPDDSEISAMQDCNEHQISYQVPHPSTGPDRQPGMQNALDVDLQALRADLKRRLMQTHVMHETLREFDSHILLYVSDKGRLEQEKDDLNLALSLVEHKCKLLESNIYFVVGRIEMEKGCVEAGTKKLQDVIARKPADPERDYTSWKRWCSDLQQHYKHLGYSKHELGEQEYALKKLQLEYDGAQAERRTLLRKLLQLDDSHTPESLAESDEDPGQGLKRRRLRL